MRSQSVDPALLFGKKQQQHPPKIDSSLDVSSTTTGGRSISQQEKDQKLKSNDERLADEIFSI